MSLLDDDFDPHRIQVAHLANLYVQQLTAKYGGYAGWIRQMGSPDLTVFLSQEELNDMYSGWVKSDPRAVTFFSWAGVPVPTGYTRTDGRTALQRPEWAVWHIIALEHIYEDRSAWK